MVATLPPDDPGLRAIWLYPLGADTRGRVIAHRARSVQADSMDLFVVQRASGRSSLVSGLRNSVPTQGHDGPRAIPGGYSVGRPPYDVRFEQPYLFPDGTIAIARYEPYRVDWFSPDGRWTRGAALPVPRVRVDARERAAYVRRHPGMAGATGWPVHVPPFDMTRPLGTPAGWLAIPRVPMAENPDPRYDVVDRQAKLRAFVTLPPNHRLLGFGKSSVYVIATRDDGIQRLQRHGWPPAGLRP